VDVVGGWRGMMSEDCHDSNNLLPDDRVLSLQAKITALEITLAQHELVNASKSQKIRELEQELKRVKS